MRRAWVRIKEAPWYRSEAFRRGLAAVGYDVRSGHPGEVRRGDLLLIWNRYAGEHDIATSFERAGGLVLVAENGYLGKGCTAPKFDVHPRGPDAGSYYSVSWDWHNGRGRWPAGGPERFAALGVELKPWRTDGGHILVAPNRSFGVGAQVMSPGWAQERAAQLRRVSRREVRVRQHPGNNAPQRPLEADLEGAWAVVVWSSSVAVHALRAGVPTFIEAPWHVVKGAGASGPVDNPETPERLPHFERMAWHQWTVSEVESGAAFRALGAAAGETQVPVGA